MIIIWLAVWETASQIVQNRFLLCGPWEVVTTLATDVIDGAFWSSIGFSLVRIAAGFLYAFIAGLLLGGLAARFRVVGEFLQPMVVFLKSTPIVCIIVLLLMWFSSRTMSVVAVFLAVFPAIYFSVIEGLRQRDGQMLEMLHLFHVPRARRFLSYTWPSLLPFLRATGKVAIGMSWKAGIAAELIGIPLGSIGEGIYQSKITLSCADLLAWTLTVVIISLICEKVFLMLLDASGGCAWALAVPRDRRAISDDAPSQSGCFDTSSGPLVFEDVAVRSADREVLSGFSLVVPTGSRICLLAPSGAGKTTLLRLLAGLQKPTTGRAFLQGARVSMVFQEARLFEDHDAIDNVRICVGSPCGVEEARSLLLMMLPEDCLLRPVSQLSGGQRRRVEIARALLAHSQVLLLDEPFSSLDDGTHSQVAKLVSGFRAGRTLIVASHDADDAMALDAEILRVG